MDDEAVSGFKIREGERLLYSMHVRYGTCGRYVLSNVCTVQYVRTVRVYNTQYECTVCMYDMSVQYVLYKNIMLFRASNSVGRSCDL